MSQEAVARRYATAVLEIGRETGQLATLSTEIGSFAETYAANAELREVLNNPLVPHTEQQALLLEIASRLGASQTTKSTLRLLAEKRRLTAVVEIGRQLAKMADEEAKVVRAEVTSAQPLSPAYLAKLTAELERVTGKKVVIATREDKSLIAGVVTKIGDRVIDGSVRARLASFKDSLTRAQ